MRRKPKRKRPVIRELKLLSRKEREREAVEAFNAPIDEWKLWERKEASSFQETFLARDTKKDQQFALALLAGYTTGESAQIAGLTEQMVSALLDFPPFRALVTRLKKEQEGIVYDADPDKMTENLARGNVWVLKEIRDNPKARDADRLRCALILHEMRPSVIARKSKQIDTGMKVTFNTDVMKRLQDGLTKIKAQSVIEVKASPAPGVEGQD